MLVDTILKHTQLSHITIGVLLGIVGISILLFIIGMLAQK